ncbi:ABC transporter substrate-binding protein [Pseudodonghicola flavimaris]|uniref:ABC transporter substrate-binding protein n=1 Tax=Pseudodonghicola flavimaris TaxID=3050036 RepID=A0ABT7F569_9RHOB|nr:ABC transporter substrate-binding protein [Pseudodonghicola flavimaris]MDK3019758.1 ABC transporter substrate-binding protein [Pseudodonghicola flavimaris]
MTNTPLTGGRFDRRGFLKTGAAALAATGLARPALAQSRTIKIGMVMPQTGPLAFFSEHVEFVLNQMQKATGGVLNIDGRQIAYEILLRDSQSNPNRASEVASELILDQEVDLIIAAATPETTVPVSDMCELNGIPCVTNDTPIEPYFFARGGDPDVGFEWTNHYFFSGQQSAGTLLKMFGQIESNKMVGALWPNDGDGNAFAEAYPPLFDSLGYGLSDPGRFDMPLSSYAAAVSQFKADEVELIYGVIPPPEFTTFWNEAAQQKFQPKAVYAGKTVQFPAALEPFGARAEGLVTEVWWAPVYPYASTITGQTAKELADEYEAVSGRQWSMPLGFRHSIFEVIFDGLKRAQDLDDPASIQEAFNTTDLTTVCGPIDFRTGPFPNTCTTPTAGGQWVKGEKYPLDLVICDNLTAPEVEIERQVQPLTY